MSAARRAALAAVVLSTSLKPHAHHPRHRSSAHRRGAQSTVDAAAWLTVAPLGPGSGGARVGPRPIGSGRERLGSSAARSRSSAWCARRSPSMNTLIAARVLTGLGAARVSSGLAMATGAYPPEPKQAGERHHDGLGLESAVVSSWAVQSSRLRVQAPVVSLRCRPCSPRSSWASPSSPTSADPQSGLRSHRRHHGGALHVRVLARPQPCRAGASSFPSPSRLARRGVRLVFAPRSRERRSASPIVPRLVYLIATRRALIARATCSPSTWIVFGLAARVCSIRAGPRQTALIPLATPHHDGRVRSRRPRVIAHSDWSSRWEAGSIATGLAILRSSTRRLAPPVVALVLMGTGPGGPGGHGHRGHRARRATIWEALPRRSPSRPSRARSGWRASRHRHPS